MEHSRVVDVHLESCDVVGVVHRDVVKLVDVYRVLVRRQFHLGRDNKVKAASGRKYRVQRF